MRKWCYGNTHQRAQLRGWALAEAKESYEDALTAAKAAAGELITSGVSEAEAARAVGLNRMTIRKALAAHPIIGGSLN